MAYGWIQQKRKDKDPADDVNQQMAYGWIQQKRKDKDPADDVNQQQKMNSVAAVEVSISSEAVDDNLRRIARAECQLLSSIQMEKATEACKEKDASTFTFTEERCTKIERRQDSLLER
ncbi:hypothetical protein F511_10416 [Dorcoceras hygrometricum]|uniref:Uncharacterized protein n=1 Tax=Dorcoceras hygrometricum TaxID=472368 RepID=A0A2Z7ATI0_9LAMI|nr:hypothetical protein F511_10416 [Dorcoceras hygrometricum]